jgi:signal transduction histidine kinase
MRHRSYFRAHQRPPWWPENETWPPSRDAWRRMRPRPFLRRLGCMFGVFILFSFFGFLAFIGFILDRLNIIHVSVGNLQWVVPLGGLLFVFTLFLFALTARNLRRVSAPLDELLDASNKVAEGDYSVRVAEKGLPEVRSLMTGFNSMASRLQENDQQRRAMLADVSHELRTPITVIQGNVEGILDGLYPADEARLKSIMEETQLLSRLVDDLRTLALAESGSLQLKREPTDLGLLIREVISAYATQAQEQEIKVELALDDIADVEIDPQRVHEVLSNLMSNALRYTPSQGVVKVGVAESTSGLREARSVLVYVQDSGPGIESADLSHIFDRFYKSSDSGGMGLGLSIAKYLVEAHGGKIWAESDIVPEGEAGQGTKISFEIPVRFEA